MDIKRNYTALILTVIVSLWISAADAAIYIKFEHFYDGDMYEFPLPENNPELNQLVRTLSQRGILELDIEATMLKRQGEENSIKKMISQLKRTYSHRSNTVVYRLTTRMTPLLNRIAGEALINRKLFLNFFDFSRKARISPTTSTRTLHIRQVLLISALRYLEDLSSTKTFFLKSNTPTPFLTGSLSDVILHSQLIQRDPTFPLKASLIISKYLGEIYSSLSCSYKGTVLHDSPDILHNLLIQQYPEFPDQVSKVMMQYLGGIPKEEKITTYGTGGFYTLAVDRLAPVDIGIDNARMIGEYAGRWQPSLLPLIVTRLTYYYNMTLMNFISVNARRDVTYKTPFSFTYVADGMKTCQLSVDKLVQADAARLELSLLQESFDFDYLLNKAMKFMASSKGGNKGLFLMSLSNVHTNKFWLPLAESLNISYLNFSIDPRSPLIRVISEVFGPRQKCPCCNQGGPWPLPKLSEHYRQKHLCQLPSMESFGNLFRHDWKSSLIFSSDFSH